MEANDFNTNALTTFRKQWHGNAPYRNYCTNRNASIENIIRWQDIPALVTDCFKSPTLPVKTGDFRSAHIFHTSGTTGREVGQHHFPDLSRYSRSVIDGWPCELAAIAETHRVFFLDQPFAYKPHSSLTAMFQILAEHWELDDSCWLRDEEGQLHAPPEEETDKPFFVFGTASAFVELFALNPTLFPVGSICMETGGYKATGMNLSKEDFYDLFRKNIGVDAENIWNEYSMTELSSQFYTHGLDEPHCGPEWTRIRVIDPATGADAPEGEPGYLIIYDLANEHSVMAIQTQDIAIAKGDRHFHLTGRDPAALPRGCSRAI